MNAYLMWRFIAKLRKQEGDIEGSKRALRNANATKGFHYLNNSGPHIVWTQHRAVSKISFVKPPQQRELPTMATKATATPAVPVISAKRAARLATAQKIAVLALAELPVHEFGTGSVGRSVSGRVEVEGTTYTVIVSVIDTATITKAGPVIVPAPVVEAPAKVAKPRKSRAKAAVAATA